MVGGMFRVNSPAVEEASFLEERERREGEAFMTECFASPQREDGRSGEVNTASLGGQTAPPRAAGRKSCVKRTHR